MADAIIRIPGSTYTTLRDLSRQSGEPVSELVTKAVEKLRREFFLEATNRAFATLREEPDTWQAELEERMEWDVTLRDRQEDC